MGRIISQGINYSGITLSQQSLPIGAIVPYMGTTAPSGYLACDGTVYSISLYPLLAGFIEAQFGSINYFGGDGTTTFAVPNLQGEFLRGTGTNGHTNQGSGGSVGEHQDGTEFVYYKYMETGQKIVLTHPDGGSNSPSNVDASRTTSGNLDAQASASNVSSSNSRKFTSRPTNTSVLYIIKARPDRLDKITFAEVDDESVSSDVVWSSEKLQSILDTICAPNAGAHNGIYRGKNLGTSVSAEQIAAIRAGTFDDLFIGDYWVIGGYHWRIMHFDYWLGIGDTEFTSHHAVIIPDEILYEAKMNDSDTASNGYLGSKMHTTNLASAKATINSAFPNMILSHRLMFSDAFSGGAVTGAVWTDSEIDLPSVYMIYGNGSRGTDGAPYASNTQLAAMFLKPELIISKDANGNRKKYWLYNLLLSGFMFAGDTGIQSYSGSSSTSLGVRPAFALG